MQHIHNCYDIASFVSNASRPRQIGCVRGKQTRAALDGALSCCVGASLGGAAVHPVLPRCPATHRGRPPPATHRPTGEPMGATTDEG